MKVAIYPGSFNPWHEGHEDVLQQSLKVFDEVIIARGVNFEKGRIQFDNPRVSYSDDKRIKFITFYDLLVNIIDKHKISAVIKGLRNGQDFEYEKIQQYWNEDLGLTIPTFYVISNRSLVHVSSSAIRTVKSFKK